MKIGIFDSGMGGNFSLAVMQQKIPQHKYVLFCDHKNAPYGNKSPEQILELTTKGCDYLFSQNCQIVLLACNTACARSLRALQESRPHQKILGCLVPAIEMAIEQGGERIGLIATKHTIETKKYHREAFKVNPQVKIFDAATPELAGWIENGKQETEISDYLKEKIGPLITQEIDTLILGCTHYHILKPHIEALFPNINIVDSVDAQAEKFIDYLNRHSKVL